MKEYKLKPIFIEAEKLFRAHYGYAVGKKADVNLSGVFAVESGIASADTGKGLFGMGSEFVKGTVLRCADNSTYFLRVSKEEFLSRYAEPT